MPGWSQQLLRPAAGTLVASGFLVVALLLGGLYLWSPHATLRITTGPAGGVAQRFVSALVFATTQDHPRIRFETVEVGSLAQSAKALEDDKVDIAIARSDVAPPANGQSLVILRRDVVALVAPAVSAIKDVSQLAGKTVAIPANVAQDDNVRALDRILEYFNVAPVSVKRIFLPVSEIGSAIQSKRASVALAVGPIGPGDVVDAVASIAKASGGAPTILPMDLAGAISKRFPGFEEIEIPEGAFRGNPPTPAQATKGLAVTYRLAIPARMLNAVAGLLARSVLKIKAKLMALTPLANQIEPPDPSKKNPTLPVHPGVAAYLASGDRSFLEELKSYLYVIGLPLSLGASVLALVAGLWRNRKLEEDRQRLFRLLVISDLADRATPAEIDELTKEFHAIVAICVQKLVDGSGATDQAPVSLAIEHARRALELRKTILGTQTANVREPRA